MKDHLPRIIEKFLLQHHDGKRPILLALSGGPDSLALLHLLHECCRRLSVEYSIAHVDHGWRKESTCEARQLAQLSDQLAVPFHCKRVHPPELRGNLEASGRDARLRFFRHLCHSYDYQAVLLAHHRQDQAETVLKQIFEGGHIFSCTGMKEHTVMDGLTVWRPLLDVPKSKLLKWLETNNRKPFFDATNHDPRFLRARIRTQIIPEMAFHFGKEIASPLCQMGQESQELRQYFEEKLGCFLQAIDVSATGAFLDLSASCPRSLLEIKFILRKLCLLHRCVLSREILEKGAEHLLMRSANRTFQIGTCILYIDRGRLFLSTVNLPEVPAKREKIEGTTRYGPWLVTAERRTGAGRSSSTGWKEIWKGRAKVILPWDGEPYHIGSPLPQHPFPRSSPLRKWWNRHKVPAFLRPVTPVIWSEDQITHEFLSGQNRHGIEEHEESLQLILIRQNEFESE